MEQSINSNAIRSRGRAGSDSALTTATIPTAAMYAGSAAARRASFSNSTDSQSLRQFSSSLLHLNHPGLLSPKEGNKILLDLVEFMIDGVDPHFLKFASRFLTAQDYEDIVDERNIIHRCGYPLCNNDPKGIRQQHQINYREKTVMILPGTYMSKYCEKAHYQASMFYKAQLSDEPIFARKDITYLPYGACKYELHLALLEEIQAKSFVENKSLKQVIEEFKYLSVDENKLNRRNSTTNEPLDPFLAGLSEQIKEFKIQERDDEDMDEVLESTIPDDSMDATGIEGYSVQRDYNPLKP